MENQFTTTFVPKKPLGAPLPGTPSSQPVSRPVGFLWSMALILGILTLALAGSIYAFRVYTQQQIVTLAEQVSLAEKDFEPQLITQLQILDKQLRNAQLMIKNHMAISPLLDLLELSTLKNVQFNKFDLVVDDIKGIQVRMSGLAQDYDTIAQQSDSLGASTFLKNVIFSNFYLTPQGKVSFDLSFGIIPEFFNFATAPLSSVTPR